MKIVNSENFGEQKDFSIYDWNERGLHLCCEQAIIDGIQPEDFRTLLVRVVSLFGEVCKPEFVFDYVAALNKREFHDGELLDLFDGMVKDDIAWSGLPGNSYQGELTQLLSYFIDENVQSILDPCGGVMDLAINMPGKRFVAYEEWDTTCYIAAFRLALAGLLDQTVLCNSNEVNWTIDKFDAIVSCPEESATLYEEDKSIRKVYEAILSHFEDTTNENGQLAMVVTLDALYDDGEVSHACREAVTKNNWLDTVVVLPKFIFSKSDEQFAIVVLKKKRERDEVIRFVDASDCTKRREHIFGMSSTTIDVDKAKDLIEHGGRRFTTVTIEEVLEHGASWFVGWYLYLHNVQYRTGYEVVPVSDILKDVYHPCDDEFEEKVGRLVSREDLSHSDIVRFEYKPEDFHESAHLRGARRIAEPVLLLDSEKMSFPMYVEASEDNPIFIEFIDFEIWAFAIKNCNAHIGYLCKELSQRYAEFYSFIMKHKLSYLEKRKLFNSVSLSLPSLTEQEALFEENKRAAQEGKVKELDLQKTIDNLIAESKKQYRERKHSLSQNTVALQSCWKEFWDYLNGNGGRYDENDIYGKLHPVKIGEIVNTITENINIIEEKVYHFTEEGVDWGEEEEIDLQDFIDEYISNNQNPRYVFSFKYRQAMDKRVLIPKKALMQVFDNIVSNARDHGFVDQNNPNYTIRFDLTSTFDSIVLDISNNGRALDEGVDTAYLIVNGNSTKMSAKEADEERSHSGIGGYQADCILKKYNATMELISEPNSQFAVTYRIIFNNIKNV